MIRFGWVRLPVPEQQQVPAKAEAVTPAVNGQSGAGMEVERKSAPIMTAPLANIRNVVRLARRGYGIVDQVVFVKPRKFYPSYADFWKLVELSGFEAIYQDEIDLADPRQTYVFAAPEAIPDCTGAQARTIYWCLEYAGDYTKGRVKHAETVGEVWSSDPTHARQIGAQYVLLGSHRGLKPDLDAPKGNEYDLLMLAYMTARREAIQQRLTAYRWPEDYPGHDGARRHEVLSTTRLMLVVHQHDQPALAPIRMALAAAYRMTMICESVPDAGLYKPAVIWADYADLPNRVETNLKGKDGTGEAGHYGDKLYQLLCVEHPFAKGVLAALEAGEAALGRAA